MGKRMGRRAALAATAGLCLTLGLAPAAAWAAAPNTAAAGSVAAQAANGLPTAFEFHKVKGDIAAGQTFSMVSSTTTDGHLRIVHLTDGTTKIDRCIATRVDDKLEPTDCTIGKFHGTGAHEWTIDAVEGGFTVKSNTKSGSYLHIEDGSVSAGSEVQVLSIEKRTDGTYAIGRKVGNAMRYLSYGASGWTSSSDPYGVWLYQETEVAGTIVPNGNDATGTTQGQPFESGTGGSANFRIPSLTTLDDGTMLAAIDARWNTQVDAGGLDTILSRSTDGGKTWTYSFPNYFNDSTDAYNNRATAFIDPVMVQDNNGTVHLMVDLWPGGVALNSAANNHPVSSSGYVKIDGAYRLVLYGTPNPDAQRAAGAERGEGYTHYVGDFAADGFAPVVNAQTGKVERYVDRQYYLFDANKQPVYCQQLGSSNFVQQNVFYFNADLHVTATSYLWKISSTDGGKTWSDPAMLNEQVRTGLAKNDSFYGVGPGRGLVTSTGRIVLPCYTFNYGKGDGVSSVIYSDDGETWHRSESLDRQTSEATVVEADGKLYMFARHGVYAVSNDDGATWEQERSLVDTGIPITTSCQIDAITYSQKIDGKTAILLSGPTGKSRANGAIFVGLVQEDGSIVWKYRHDVTTGGAAYSYSCLTEKADGSLGLLYEGTGTRSVYRDFAIADVAPDAKIGVYLEPTFSWADDYASATATFKHSTGAAPAVVDATVSSERTEPTATEDGKVVYTATVEFEGKTYTDVQTVVLPATGTPDPDPDPEQPEPGTPEPGKPGQGTGGSSTVTPGGGTSAGGSSTGSGAASSKGAATGAAASTGKGGSKSVLPTTGDAAALVGVVSTAGAALAALGVGLTKRR